MDTVYIDNELTLFGANSVIGRAVVIYDSEDIPIACANIKEPGNRSYLLIRGPHYGLVCVCFVVVVGEEQGILKHAQG